MPATRWRRRRPRCTSAQGGLRPGPVPASRAPTSPTIPMCWRPRRSCAHAAIASAICSIVAPVDGVIAQRTVQVGQQVARRHAADGGGAARPMSGSTPISRKCQLARHAHRPAGRRSPPTSMAASVTYHGQVEGLGAGSRQRLRAAAAAECLRQLDQDRAARAGAHRARSGGAGAIIRCASAFRSTSRVDVARHVRPAGRRAASAPAPCAAIPASDGGAEADALIAPHPRARMAGR